MAVKPKRIKARIKELFPKVNLSQSRINELSVKLSKKPANDAEDDSLDEVINDFNEIYPFSEIAKEDDQKRSSLKKIKDLQDAKEIDDDLEGGDPGPDDDDQKGKNNKKKDEIPSWAQKLIDQNKTLSDKVEGFEAKKKADIHKTEARKIFDSSEVIKKLPEAMQNRLFNSMELNNEENSIEDQMVDLEGEFEGFVDASSTEDNFTGKPPGGKGDVKPSDAELDAIVNDL